jgi:nucleoid-associated protein YgaU
MTRQREGGMIRIRGKTFDFSHLLAGEATVTGGTATWEATARPEQRALTVYAGTELFKLDVPILIDGWPDEGIGWEVQRLIDLSRGDGIDRPPDFRADGPIPNAGGRYVMELPEWGEAIRSKKGDLVRQYLTLKLVEFVDPDRLRPHKIGGKKGGNHGGKPNQVVVKDHETLLQVAARVYGDSSRAREIGKLNDIRDIRKPLQQGRKLTLPRHGKGKGDGKGES